MDLVHFVSHSPVFKISLQTDVRASIMASPSVLTNSAGVLSTPSDLPIYSALTAASAYSSRWIRRSY